MRTSSVQTIATSRSFRRHVLLLAVCVMATATFSNDSRADWPQYRADAARCGHVAGELPGELSLHWSYESPHPPAPAWLGTDTRKPFDHVYQPVIADGTVYFGSSVDGMVYALDANTGAQQWTFHTDGPVRFAPAIWEGRVFVVSDDGHLYCLAGDTGRLLWKRRGGPQADMLLGNARMIGRWPARGGPVISDDILYFGAGIWPSEGIYLYALDPATGDVLWLNGEAGGLEWDQPHGGARAASGVSAQGYFVATQRQLIVPTGRGIPAVFDRDDGTLQQFYLQAYGRIGGADIVAMRTHFFNSGHLFDAFTGRSRGRAIPPVDRASYQLHMRGHAALEDGLEEPLTVTPDRVVFGAGDQLVARRWVEEPVVHRTGEEGVAKRLIPATVWDATQRQPESVPGHLGSAVHLDGEEYIETAPFGFDYNHITIAAWVKPSDLDGRFTIFDNRNENACPGLEIGRGNRVSVITPGVWMVETEDDVVQTDQWQHIVYTRDGPGNTHAIYINGQKQPLATALEAPYESTATPKDIGRRGNGSQHFQGLIDQVAVYDRAVSEQEVQALYHAVDDADVDDTDTHLPVRDGLVLYLPMDQPVGPGAKVADRSGSGHDGHFIADVPIEAPHVVTAIISVGQSLALGGDGRVSVMHADDEGDSRVWTAEVKGVVRGLAFAGGRLYASTTEGILYCFGAKRGEAEQAATRHAPAIDSDPYGVNAHYAAVAEEIIERTGVTEGYAVDLASGDGALAYELAKRTDLHIYAVDDDPQRVRAARQKLVAAGLYGSRVTVHLADPAQSNYPNYFADLAVSGRYAADDHAGTLPEAIREELHRLTRPFGGVVCVGRPSAMDKHVRGPLEGTGEWTHQYADAGASAISTDDRVKAPLGMLWFRDYDGIEMPMRHGRGPAPLSREGRLFVMGVHGVYAMDAYNGRLLWEHLIPGILDAYDQHHLAGVSITGGTFCLEGDSLYVRHQDRCYQIDVATGEKRAHFTVPETLHSGEDAPWGFVAVSDGTLIGSTADPEHIVRFPYRRGGDPVMDELLSESTALFAMDADNGEHRWTFQAKYSIRHNSIVLGGGVAYLIDSLPHAEDLLDEQRRRGREDVEPPPAELVAIDATTGEVLWREVEDVFGTMLALSVEHDKLLMSYQRTRFQLQSEQGGRMAAFHASTGERVWDIEAGYNSRPILNDSTIYAQPGAWDLLTGRQKEFSLSRSYGCSIIAGSTHLLAFRSATLGFRDLSRPDSGTKNYGGIRPGCWLNTIAAGGLLLMPDASDKCTCSYLNKAYIALQPMSP